MGDRPIVCIWERNFRRTSTDVCFDTGPYEERAQKCEINFPPYRGHQPKAVAMKHPRIALSKVLPQTFVGLQAAEPPSKKPAAALATSASEPSLPRRSSGNRRRREQDEISIATCTDPLTSKQWQPRCSVPRHATTPLQPSHHPRSKTTYGDSKFHSSSCLNMPGSLGGVNSKAPPSEYKMPNTVHADDMMYQMLFMKPDPQFEQGRGVTPFRARTTLGYSVMPISCARRTCTEFLPTKPGHIQ